ncbi:MAG: DUF1573 domain-containing protein [Nibricoccus sp.]
MKKPVTFLSLVLFLLAGSVSMFAGLQADPAAVDLGRRQQEQTIAFEVKLVNNGKAPLEILSVRADCSCTAAAPGKRTLAPGESTPLQGSVETRGYIGRLRRNVLVQTSAGELTIPIDLNISLFKNWSLEPSTIIVPPSPKGQVAEVKATLQHFGNGRVQLGKITCAPDWLQAVSKSDDGKNFQLQFIKPADAPAGNYTVKVAVATNDSAEPNISFNVFVPITSTLRVSPNPVVFPTVKAGQKTVREITIVGWTGGGTPQLVLQLGEARLIDHENGKFRYELTVTPANPGPFTQLMRVYDGDKLEAELPLIARAEPVEAPKP